ncbi:MAG: hypothetical protein HZC28_03190 [Spirochaetes bacterium]|nr:hypothetical protein [Spirochaetota bacterium]
MKKVLMFVAVSVVALTTAFAAETAKPAAKTATTAAKTEMAAKAELKGLEQTLTSKEAKVGDTVVCPVMKMDFKVTAKSLFVDYKGKKIYVCCKDCVAAMKKDAVKYLTPAKADDVKKTDDKAPAKAPVKTPAKTK